LSLILAAMASTALAAEEDISTLVPIFDSRTPEAQVKIVEQAALSLSPDRDVLLIKALASKDKTVRDAALKVLERTGEPRTLLEAVAAGTGPKAERDRARAALDRWSKPPALPSPPAVTPTGAPPKPGEPVPAATVRKAPGPADAPALRASLAAWLRENADANRSDVDACPPCCQDALDLGRMGDTAAVPLLRWATDHPNILVRWHAAAALKMIEMHAMPEKDRKAAAAEWLRHSFSSPEEHFMARADILGYLGEVLGPDAKPAYADIATTATDPWMKFDIARAIEKIDNAEAVRTLTAAAAGADPKTRAEALRGLLDRKAPEAGPLLVEALLDNDQTVRTEAIRGLELIGPGTSAAPLAIHLASGNIEWQERAAAEKALAAVCLRSADKDALTNLLADAMLEATGPTRVSFVRVLGRLGGPRAAKAVFEAINVTNSDVREAAVHALASWPDGSAVDALVDIAWYNSETLHQPLPADARSLAIRGLVRLAAEEPSAERREAVLDKAYRSAAETEEKKAVIAGFGDFATAGSLTYMVRLMDDSEVAEEAAAAAVRIVRAAKDLPPAAVRAAMEKVLVRSRSDATHQSAQAILAKIISPR